MPRDVIGGNKMLEGFLIVGGAILLIGYVWVRILFSLSKTAKIEALNALAEEMNAKCANCVHFDLEEGQAVMAQNPIFLEAARHVPPNTMMRKLDENGVELPNEHAFQAKENRWQLFGACTKHEQLRHCSDHCEKFQKREPRTGVPQRGSR